MGAIESLAACAAEGRANLALIELRRIELPLLRPHRAAHGTETVREVVVVGASDADGVVGWGECPTLSSPGYTSEFTASAWDHLGARLLPALWAGDLDSRLAGGVVLDEAFPMASSGVEAALVDLGLRRRGQRLADVLGARTDRVPRCSVVSMESEGRAGAVVEAVERAVASGVALVKLKVGPHTGVEAVRLVRRHFPQVPVAVDANGSLAGHRDLIASLGGLGLVYIEQPLPPRHPDAAAVARQLGGAVALDESATSPAALAVALEAGEGTIVNLKPARVGGLVPALRCAQVAASAGAQMFVGGMLESAVGRAGALALAAAGTTAEGALPTDLGPSSQYFATDLAGPVVTDEEGHLVVPAGVGIGVEPGPEVLAACTVDSWTSVPG